MKMGFDVFQEVGNSARFDLVVSAFGKLQRVQVKSTYTRKGVACLSLRTRSGAKTLRYAESEVDVFALYVIDRDMVVYISAKAACSKSCLLSIRLDPAKNNQKRGLNHPEVFKWDVSSIG